MPQVYYDDIRGEEGAREVIGGMGAGRSGWISSVTS